MSARIPVDQITPPNTQVHSTPAPSVREWRRGSELPPIRKASEMLKAVIAKPDEIVKGMLSLRSTMIYGGGSKTNKTFALLDLAISVAAGVPWLDLETTQGRVLYLDFELDDYQFQKRVDAISNAKDVSGELLESLVVWNLRGHAKCIKDLAPHIMQHVQDGEYKLIIIDPIYKVLGDRDENSAGDINSLMNELEAIAVNAGAAIVVGHHFSKGGQSGKESMDRISGSGVFARSPDAIVIITKHEQEDVYTIETTLRNFKRIEPFCVKWEYPLMTRNEEMDPKKLKQGGAAKTKYATSDLLKSLGTQELTTKEWLEATQKTKSMSKRTFMEKKSEIVGKGTLVTEKDGKWKAISPTPPPGYKACKNEEVQGADGAIASSASSSGAVCGGAAAALS